MQSDLFDKKIREAADHHHPAYDEHAWKKMRKLLDKHMPEEDDRRKRYFFLIPLFILLGGGVWMMFTQPWKPGSANTVTTAKDPLSAPEKSGPSVGSSQMPQTADDPDVNSQESPFSPGDEQAITGIKARDQKKNPDIFHLKNSDGPSLLNAGSGITEHKTQPEVKTESLAEDPASMSQNVGVIEKPVAEELNSIAKQEPLASDSEQQNDPENETKKPKSKKALSKLFFFLASGPDISFTSTSSMGQTRMPLGIGAGFQVKDRFLVRTGFFTARKVYTAAPDDYDPPPLFWNYYPNMQKIDADCKVYEVPLLVSYQFGHSAKHNWIATAGISSYFMKEEKYQYYYKQTPSSPISTRSYTVKNRFEHHFSVLTLSGGYKKQINKRISVAAEPYFKLPLDGIGFGKVKLKSGGIMLSVGIHPFEK